MFELEQSMCMDEKNNHILKIYIYTGKYLKEQ